MYHIQQFLILLLEDLLDMLRSIWNLNERDKMKSFNLFGTKWKIKEVDKITSGEDNHEVFGQADTSSKIIRLANSVDGSIQEGDEKEITRLHELVHAIFFTGQYLSCNDDEPLVEWTARCLFQLKKQNIL